MDVGVGKWVVGKTEPSDIFDSIGLDAIGLLGVLDSKLHAITNGEERARTDFVRWLAAFRQFSSAIAFHGGEMLSEGNGPLTAIIIGENQESLLGLRVANSAINLEFIDTCVICWDDLCRSTLQGDGALLRSYISSELLLMFKDESCIAEWTVHGAMSKLRFEEQPLDDLSWMIANDVKMGIIKDPADFDEVDFSTGKRINLKRVAHSEFAKIAEGSMRKRRVSEDVRKPLLDRTRKRLSQGL
jgi:hypothetical protein